MASLLDIAPLTGEVPVRGTSITTYGVTVAGVLYLAREFEEVRLLIDGRISEMKPEKLMTMAPKTIAHVIAVGTTDPGLKEEPWLAAVSKGALRAKSLAIGDQMALVVSIFDLTFAAGFGPFIVALNSLTRGLSSAQGPGNEPPPPRSGSAISASLVTDISQLPQGNSLHAN